MTTADVVGEDLASQLDQDGVADLFATSAGENESLPIPVAIISTLCITCTYMNNCGM